MNAHTRFALPMNTHGNLKYLSDKAQAHADRADNQTPEASAAAAKPRRDSSASKLARKMKTLFSDKNAKAAAATPEEEAAANERKRSTMSRLIGSHAFEQMGRRR
ncbi:Nef-associated protein 1 [Phytophthora cinnamomi]|uniref:Nef-associated protein 1 n=1 Tax=Phytophthora cinnamomi TaxID=4785 RepID=UPI00355A8D7D|nr:Nef-associated protein 1 [Phytophthora cinnamomi]KAG6614749.1 Nef-associated protein 1 [Phytophthora cinnamomi]